MPEIFSTNGDPAPGIVTTHDEFAISESRQEAREKVQSLLKTATEADARDLFRLCGQAQWNYSRAKSMLSQSDWESLIVPICYRPFDTRYTVFDSNVAVHRRERVMAHYLRGENIGLIVGRQGQVVGGMQWNLVFCTNLISDFNLYYRGGGASFPLYLYPAAGELDQVRRVNLASPIFSKIQSMAADAEHGVPSELEVFDYIYGVLHCPAYRELFADFLRADFPRIPWPTAGAEFWDVSFKGGQLRRLHLMDTKAIGSTPYAFKGEGEGVVDAPMYDDRKVWINRTQYFEDVPVEAWGYYIGGYQPAQKWLKDRKGRGLSFDDVRHYQRIIKVLAETDRVMRTITMALEPVGD